MRHVCLPDCEGMTFLLFIVVVVGIVVLYLFVFFLFKMSTSAVLLDQFVTSMPTVRTLLEATFVSAKPDILEMEKRALVRNGG